jgi:penicillin-binding protein 2
MRRYYARRFGANFSAPAEELFLAIGQGANTQTVVNMARFYTALATDGHAAQPSIAVGDPVRHRIFNLTPEQTQALRDAMTAVVSGAGTAGSAAIRNVSFAGKTGTAQNPPPAPDHGWFVGFAPTDEPKIVIAVFIEFGLHGSRAARIASRIVEHYLKRDITAPQVTGQ